MINKTFAEAIRAAFPDFDGELLPTTTAAEVPGWDSFGHIQLLFELEDRFGVKLDPTATLSCNNVGELFALVSATA